MRFDWLAVANAPDQFIRIVAAGLCPRRIGDRIIVPAMPEIDFLFLIERPCEAESLRADIERIAPLTPTYKVGNASCLKIKGYRDSPL